MYELRVSRQAQQHAFRGSNVKPRAVLQRVHRGRVSTVCTAVKGDVGVNDLLNWALSKGASAPRVAAGLSISTDGYALVASKEVAPGEPMLSLPEGLWLTTSVVKKSPVGKLVEGLEAWVQLSLYLIHSKDSGSDDLYIQSLPDELNSPLLWSNSELEELRGTQLIQSVQSYRSFFESRFFQLQQELFSQHPGTFPSSIFTLEKFLWAVGTVRSRLHSPLEGDDVAMVPVADATPHSTKGNTCWKLKGGGLFGQSRSLVVEATKNIRVGEALTLDYAPAKYDSGILLDYGILDTSHPRAGYQLTLNLPEADRNLDDKLDILETNGMNDSMTFTLSPSGSPSEDMLAFLRLMQLGGADAFLLEALFRNDVWGHLLLPVSEANEQAVCRAMVEGAQEALTAYPTTIDEDLALLRSGQLKKGSRREMAVQVRLGEKEALDNVLRFFEEREQNLKRLEYYQERRLKRLGLIDDQGRTTYDSFFKDGIA